MAGIGIVSSIDFQNTAQGAAFMAGAAQPANFIYKIKDKLGFNRKRIAEAINAFVADQSITLIVTVGGLITCHETIINNNSKFFISLVGFLPPAPFPQPAVSPAIFRGCVTLDTVVQNTSRLSWIAGAPWNIAAANVGLLYDANTAMAQQEIAAWTAAQAGLAVPADNGVANPSNYSQDFQKFKDAGMQAVVISAAPSHHRNREQLIYAANASGLDICYPLKGYASGAVKPVHNKAVTIGPDLDASDNTGAYWLLGDMAHTIVGNANPSTLIVSAPPTTNQI